MAEWDYSEYFCTDCSNGDLTEVKRLLNDPRVDPSCEGNEPLRLACVEGHLEVVKLLLQDLRVDPSDRDNIAIGAASDYGHLDVVKLLLQDPRLKFEDMNSPIVDQVKKPHVLLP